LNALAATSASHKRRILLLGATGSIGENTLAVLRANPHKLELVGIAGHRQTRKLAAIASEFGVRAVGIADPDTARSVDTRDFPPGSRFFHGPEGLEEMAATLDVDIVLVAIVGTGGLRPTLAAIRAGRTIALASKEILVLAGEVVMREVRRTGVQLLPVDSEHNAVFQCLHGNDTHELACIHLTASGGALRDRPLEQLASVTPADALKHPTWSMGAKITIDSATMANKGLELIEAHWLFGLPEDRIRVVIHPQSIVHSMVEFVDGSILAQLSPPSMTFAIQHALLYPQRHDGTKETLDFSRLLRLEFSPPDPARYPCLDLARQALRAGGAAPAVFNAANEQAVDAFMRGAARYTDIPRIIECALACHGAEPSASLDDLLEADRRARRTADAAIQA
jgi:1-deoxy-D-xylulose-5-phosphate reductoisomerase